MSTEYKSKKVELAAPIDKVYARFSNPENLKVLIENAPADKVPADKLEQLRSLEVTPDSIKVPGGPTGAVTLRVCERVDPTLIAFRPEGIPIDLKMLLLFEQAGEEATEAQAVITADIPLMLRPMVKGPLQQVVDQFATLMAAMPF